MSVETSKKKPGFFLSEITQDGELYSVEALRVGRWFYPFYSEDATDPRNFFELSQETLKNMVDRFHAGVKGHDLPLNVDHYEDEDKPRSLTTCGFVKDLQLFDNGNRVKALFTVTDPEVKEKVDNGSLKYSSSELDFAWMDPEACGTLGDCSLKEVFEGLALTNYPHLKRMQPVEPVVINLSEFCKCGGCRHDTKEVTVPKTVEELQAELSSLQVQLKDANGSAEKMAAVEVKLSEISKELATKYASLAEDKKTTDAKLAEVEARANATQASLELSQITERLKSLVRKGKLTVPIYTRALALCGHLIQGGSRNVQLSTKVKVKLADGSEQDMDKIDVVSEVLDMLQDLPDSISTDGDNTIVDENREMQGSDTEEEMDKIACSLREKDPKLTYREAVKLAERQIRGGKS